MREPPFNHLDSTSSESIFHCVLPHNYHFSLFAGRATRGKARRAHERTLLPNRPIPDTLCPPPYLPLILRRGYLHVAPRHSASSRAAGDFFPCVSRDHFSMHSPCSSFTVASTGEGGRRSNDDGGGDGPAAAAPRPVGLTAIRADRKSAYRRDGLT